MGVCHFFEYYMYILYIKRELLAQPLVPVLGLASSPLFLTLLLVIWVVKLLGGESLSHAVSVLNHNTLIPLNALLRTILGYMYRPLYGVPSLIFTQIYVDT